MFSKNTSKILETLNEPTWNVPMTRGISYDECEHKKPEGCCTLCEIKEIEEFCEKHMNGFKYKYITKEKLVDFLKEYAAIE